MYIMHAAGVVCCTAATAWRTRVSVKLQRLLPAIVSTVYTNTISVFTSRLNMSGSAVPLVGHLGNSSSGNGFHNYLGTRTTCDEPYCNITFVPH